MRTPSIRAKLVMAIVLIVGASGVATGALVRALYDRTIASLSEDAVHGAAEAYEELEKEDVEKLSTALDVLVANPAIREAFAARDRDRLLAVTVPIHQVLKSVHGIGHWNFIEPDTRRMFLRPHLPTKFGDVIDRAGLTRAMAKQETSFGKELGKSAFALRVARPFVADGVVIGYIELGEEIDHFLAKMKEQTGNDFAMFIHKRLIDQAEWARTRGTQRNGWGDWPDVVVVNSTSAEPIVDAAAIAGATGTGQALDGTEREGAVFVRGVVPVRDASGAVVGGLAVRRDVTALHARMVRWLLVALGALAAVAIVACTLVYLFVDRLIFRRLRGMMSTMEDLSTRLAGGDYRVGAGLRATSDDEIGQFETFFGEFLSLVGNTLRGLSERMKQARPATRPPTAPVA